MDAPYLKLNGVRRLRAWANQVTKAINANKALSGISVNVTESADGRVINAVNAVLRQAGLVACHCETVDIRAKEPDCTGTKLKHYCWRALQYTRDGATGALSDRLATSQGGSGGDVALGCQLDGEGISWFFEPTAEQVTAWLAAMATSPPNSGTYRVTLFFEGIRGVTKVFDVAHPAGTWAPCGDETSSKLVLWGICYGND